MLLILVMECHSQCILVSLLAINVFWEIFRIKKRMWWLMQLGVPSRRSGIPNESVISREYSRLLFVNFRLKIVLWICKHLVLCFEKYFWQDLSCAVLFASFPFPFWHFDMSVGVDIKWYFRWSKSAIGWTVRCTTCFQKIVSRNFSFIWTSFIVRFWADVL